MSYSSTTTCFNHAQKCILIRMKDIHLKMTKYSLNTVSHDGNIQQYVFAMSDMTNISAAIVVSASKDSDSWWLDRLLDLLRYFQDLGFPMKCANSLA